MTKINLGTHDAFYADQIRMRLRAEVYRAGSKAALAKKIGISAQFLADMLNDRRAVTGKALAFLGFAEEMTQRTEEIRSKADAARAVPEWQGRTPDTPAPARVRLRVWTRCEGRCGECRRKIGPADTEDITNADH